MIVKVKQIDVEFQWQYTVYVLRSSETIKGLEKMTVCMLLSFFIDRSCFETFKNEPSFLANFYCSFLKNRVVDPVQEHNLIIGV